MPLPLHDFVRDLTPYTPGEQPTDPKVVKLNTNENPYPPAPEVFDALQAFDAEAMRKYPPATADPLRQAIADSLGVTIDQVIAGYGSDEILRLLCHAIVARNHPVISLNPSYSLYPVLASLYEGQTITIDEPAPDVDGYGRLPDAFVESPAPLAFLPNPNPPIGVYYPLSEIRRLCEANPDRVVVADEAYIAFAPESAVSLVPEYENLMVTRTFSKSHSLAGMRVGFGIGSAELVHALMSLKDSYNLPSASQVAALAAWQADSYYNETRRRVIATRDHLTTGLRERGFEVTTSHGNFVFARHPEAAKVYKQLKERDVLVRYWSKPLLDDGIRITVGTDGEIARLFAALDEIERGCDQ